MTTDLASHLDLANHHINATPDEIKALCAHVIKYGFNSAFVNPYYIPLAKQTLAGHGKVGTVISFPLGQDTLATKLFAVADAISQGADELDIAPNNALLLLDEMMTIVKAARKINNIIVIKFILETGYLTDDQIKAGAKTILASGADFVKICSGMGPRGANLNDVKLVREVLRSLAKPDRASLDRISLRETRIKVAGGIDTYEEAKAFIDAGADRIGTSAAVKIIEEFQKV